MKPSRLHRGGHQRARSVTGPLRGTKGSEFGRNLGAEGDRVDRGVKLGWRGGRTSEDITSGEHSTAMSRQWQPDARGRKRVRGQWIRASCTANVVGEASG